MQGNASDFRPIHLSSILHRTNQTDEAMRTILFTVLALLFVSDAHAQQTVVMGRVLTADGSPAADGHAALLRNQSAFPRGVIGLTETDADGMFAFELGAPAIHRFWVTAPGHEPQPLIVYAMPGDTVEVEVRLARKAIELDPLTVWHKQPPLRGLEMMDSFYQPVDNEMGVDSTRTIRWDREDVTPDANGRLSLTLSSPGDSLACSTCSSLWPFLDPARSSGSTRQAHLRVDRDGDYIVLMPTPDDSVLLAFDLSRLPQTESEGQTRWVRQSDESALFQDVFQDAERRTDAHTAERQRQLDEGVPEHEFRYDWSSDLRQLWRSARRADTDFEREIRTAAYLEVLTSAAWGSRVDDIVSRKRAGEILEAIPPHSPMWSYVPHFAGVMIDIASGPPESYRSEQAGGPLPMPATLANPKRGKYAQNGLSTRYRDYALTLAEHPDTTAQQTWWLQGMRYGMDTDDYVTYSEYGARFFSRYAEMPKGQMEQRRLNYADRTPPGMPLPAFSVPSIDDPDQLLTNADFLGRPVYVSFWATWCGPCIPKMRQLAELHERYGPDGFQLLTISQDFERQHAIDYRDAYQPMPWPQAFIGAGLDAQEGTMADLGVLGIPYGILVDSQGNVVAVDPGGDGLEAVVAALMERE